MGETGVLADQARLAAGLASDLTRPYRTGFGVRPQDLAPAYDTVSFPSRDDHLTLRGWLLHTAHPTGRSMVLLHGSNADRAINADLARRVVAAGYDVLLFDFRGCGLSDGAHQTFGNLEQRDVLGAHDFMRARGYAPSLTSFLGTSDGATALLRAAPQMPDVAAVVSDSAFNRLEPLLRAFWTSAEVPDRLVWVAMEWSRLDGTDPFRSTADAVRAMPSRAVLFIHARGDRTIPSSDAVSLRAASASPESRLWVTGGQGHMATFSAYPDEYLSRVLSFVDGQIAEREHAPQPAAPQPLAALRPGP
jgi:pimeloyl-ACP methyl ester carboxylesterase